VLRHIRQAERLRVADDMAKDAMALRRRADSGTTLGVDAVRRKVIEHLSIGSKKTYRRVLRADHLRGDLRHK
jgi:hypothetical protein